MQLDLTADEAAVVTEVLDSALGDLREQIYKAEVAEFKDTLKHRETVLKALLSRLSAGTSST
jgi:hypothetical protein